MFIKSLKINSLRNMYLIIIIILLLLSSFSFSLDIHINKEIKVFLLIDVNEFYCGSCILRFGQVVDIINRKKIGENTVGILVSDEKNSPEKLTKIIRGIKAGNNIKFPILIDKTNSFVFLKNSYDVLLIDKIKGVVRGYKYSEFIKGMNKWKGY